MVFVRWPRAVHRHLLSAGANYYLWDGTLDGGAEDDPLIARLVCDWSTRDAGIDDFLDLI